MGAGDNVDEAGQMAGAFLLLPWIFFWNMEMFCLFSFEKVICWVYISHKSIAYGGFHRARYSNRWMVFVRETPIYNG